MNNQQDRERWANELEDTLQRAIEAEAEGRHGSAEWLFKKALFFDGKLREAADLRAYVEAAGPVYEGIGN